MSINLGNAAINDLKVGTSSVSAVYLGNTKVWPAFTPVLRLYTSGSSATETAPAGATNVEIRAVGRGGAGGTGKLIVPTQGGGGGGGGYCQSSYAISGGQTLTYTINVSGSTVSSGTKSITTMDAGNGTGGGAATNYGGGSGGSGGAASGGNVSNSNGNTGFDGDPRDLGDGGSAGGSMRTLGIYGRGANGSYTPSPGTADRGDGAVEFYYT